MAERTTGSTAIGAMMRLVIPYAILAFTAYASAYAQEGHEPHHLSMPDDVELNIVIATGKDKPDIHHKETFPKGMTRQEKIDTCTAMAHEFLSHKYPDSVDAKVLIATCIVPQNIADDDT